MARRFAETRFARTRFAETQKRCVVVFGPTAGGKSSLADRIGESLDAPTVLVDSMQVYREIPVVTNQSRERPARLAGFLPVVEPWSVAGHRRAFDREVEGEERFVVDGGTGMYLNACLLDVEIFPKVPPEARLRAALATRLEPNPRRSARREELKLAGHEAAQGATIWNGNLRFALDAIYLRPPCETLDRSIEVRSRAIASGGLEEARLLKAMLDSGESPNPSVLSSVGVRELLLHLEGGEVTFDEATDRISRRTRRLARKQLKWFDKLAKTLRGREDLASLLVVESPLISMHDIIRT